MKLPRPLKLRREDPPAEESPPEREIRELTAQFYVTLASYFSKIKCSPAPPLCADAYKRVEALFAKPSMSWTDAYAIEQLLVHVMDDSTIATELEIRVREAEGALRPELAKYYAEAAKKPGITPAERRALLGRLVNDLQWRYTVNEVKRQYSKEITLSTGNLFTLSLLAFAFAVLLTLTFPLLHTMGILWLVPAVLAGAWGAAFSVISSLKGRLDASELDALKVTRATPVLASRLLIGAGAAAILYFFFAASLVTGPAFPNFSERPKLWLTQLALLVVWCFIAGFSERLIPGLIGRTEARLNGQGEPERFRPPAADVSSNGSPPASAATSKLQSAAAAADGEKKTS